MTNSTCPYCLRRDCALDKARKQKSVFNPSTGDINYSMKYAAEAPTLPIALENSPFTAEQIGELEKLYLGESFPRVPSWRDMVAPGEPALALESATVDTSWMVQEAPIECAGGLFEPAPSHWFSLEDQESRFANGLMRPDAMPDEQAEQLRELMLSRPAPKQPHKLSLEQLRALGFAPDDEPVSMPAHLETKGGLFAPDF